MSTGDVARRTLAGIRIFNGVLGLAAAHRMAKSLGSDLADDKTFVYPARMFGIRTIILGISLLRASSGNPADRRVLREAVVIHAVDTAAAAYAGWRGELPAKAAKLTTTISAVNTTLAIISLTTAPKHS